MDGVIDLPYTPLQTPLVALEPVDLAMITEVISSEDDPSRRRDDWHPDFPREDDLDGLGMATELTGWTSRLVRRLADGLVVGTIGFFGPPEPTGDGVPEVEIGFGLVERGARAGPDARRARGDADHDRPGRRARACRQPRRQRREPGHPARGRVRRGLDRRRRTIPSARSPGARGAVSIRLVATDLDGTLLRSDGTVSERTVRALRRRRAAGLHVVFVTGRPIRWAEVVFEHVGRARDWRSSPTVPWSGTCAGEVVRTLRPIEAAVGLEVAELIRDAVPGSTFAVEQVGGISLEPAFVDPERVPAGARYGPLTEIFDGPGGQAAGPPPVVGAPGVLGPGPLGRR